MSTAPQLAPYERLVELAEAQCMCIAAGHDDELARVQAQWAELTAALPPLPPAGAEPLLRRGIALVQQAERDLEAAKARLAGELAGVGRSRAVGRAYRPAEGAPRLPSIDAAA